MIKRVRNFFTRIFGNKYVDLAKIDKTKEAGITPVFNSDKCVVKSK